jgi:DNA-binding PadR family transcriptional regulator
MIRSKRAAEKKELYQMSYGRPATRNLWALTVLCLLRERPMHPYELQRLIHQRHKDDLLDLRRGSLYHAVAQLQRGGLIEPLETSREGRRPERTVYQLTGRGADELALWLHELLAKRVHEPSQFLAAVANISRLTPAEALEALDSRLLELETALAGMAEGLRTLSTRVERVALLELEYARAQQQAERDWVRAVVDDLRQGRLTWDFEALTRRLEADHGPE